MGCRTQRQYSPADQTSPSWISGTQGRCRLSIVSLSSIGRHGIRNSSHRLSVVDVRLVFLLPSQMERVLGIELEHNMPALPRRNCRLLRTRLSPQSEQVWSSAAGTDSESVLGLAWSDPLSSLLSSLLSWMRAWQSASFCRRWTEFP